jgi:hypothetical protein
MNTLYSVKNRARRDPLLGNDRETNNETTAAGRQQILNKQQWNNNNLTSISNCVFCAVRAEMLQAGQVGAAVSIPCGGGF